MKCLGVVTVLACALAATVAVFKSCGWAWIIWSR
jgi:hypothetical protein